MKAPRECPCHSGQRYGSCCGPLHTAALQATTPEALMRSRFAAFALGLGEYLVDTLADAHADRALPRAELARELGLVRQAQRFMGLAILHAEERSDEGEVLFFARVFERGKDRSFAELSRFVRERGAWRYESGILVPGEALPLGADGLTREVFLALVPISRE